MAQVTAQQPPSKVDLASRSTSRSHSDTDGGTCCPGTGERQSQPVIPCRLLLHGFPNMHLWEHRWGVLSPSIPSSLLPSLALKGLPSREEEESEDE